MTTHYLGRISPEIIANFHLVRFIDREHVKSCEDGHFLIGSIKRNREFDNARGDNGEATVTVSLKAAGEEQFLFEGIESKRYIGIAPGEKLTGIRASGFTIANQNLVNGNPLSLSFALVSRNTSLEQKIFEADAIKKSLGIAEDAACLELKKPELLINEITRTLLKNKHTDSKRIIPITGPINYATREISTNSKQEFKQIIDTLFYSGIFHIGHVFTKPNKYKNDKEFRIVWVGHSGVTNKNVCGPIDTDINRNPFIILDGINFKKHFVEFKI